MLLSGMLNYRRRRKKKRKTECVCVCMLCWRPEEKTKSSCACPNSLQIFKEKTYIRSLLYSVRVHVYTHVSLNFCIHFKIFSLIFRLCVDMNGERVCGMYEYDQSLSECFPFSFLSRLNVNLSMYDVNQHKTLSHSLHYITNHMISCTDTHSVCCEITYTGRTKNLHICNACTHTHTL